MIMANVPENDITSLGIMNAASSGVVADSVPCCDNKGDLSHVSYSLNRNDYLVASWGGCGFYTYNLAEKVWMTLGLSQRCVGNGNQKIIYDDLSAPLRAVAQGEISNEFFWDLNKNITWEMRNDYLRTYLWMRGHVGVRSFFYEASIDYTPEIKALMGGEPNYSSIPKNGWYDLNIREHLGKLWIQVKATVPAVLPEKCPQKNINLLVWPSDKDPMTQTRSTQQNLSYPDIYLKDTFLIKYEENSLYNSVPTTEDPDDIFYCNPSYKGQWAFTGLRRTGRNIIKTNPYDLYKGGIPDKEVLHAYEHAISTTQANSFDINEEHIVKKTKRFVAEILKLGHLFSAFASILGIPPIPAEDYIGFSSDKISANGWVDYPILCKLARTAPLDMSENDFLSRCKTLHECIKKIAIKPLRSFLVKSGISTTDLGDAANIRLLQGIKNILDILIEDKKSAISWAGSSHLCDWKKENPSLAPLFVNNDLRQADAHEKIGRCMTALESLGFDSAQLNDGHGRAMDFILDEVIKSIYNLNENLSQLLMS